MPLLLSCSYSSEISAIGSALRRATRPAPRGVVEPYLDRTWTGVSAREIGRLLGVARSTIQDNLRRAAVAGLQWPLAEDVTDEVLEQRLFGRAAIAAGQRRRVSRTGRTLRAN